MVGGGVPGGQNDNCIVTLKMEDGSIGTLVYVANGDPSFEKERIEVFGQNATGVIENFRRALIARNGKKRVFKPGSTGKGHVCSIAAFVDAVKRGAESPLPFDSAVATTLATFAAATAATSGGAIGLARSVVSPDRT